MNNAAVFFDRDDTLIKNIPYLGDPEQATLMPQARESLQLLHNNGFMLFIISNQSGVGRGYISKDQVRAVNDKIIELLGKNFFTDIYTCYDDPDNPIEGCRKPLPGMLLRAEKAYHINLQNSYIVGDRLHDIEAGVNAGCKSILYVTKSHPEEKPEALAKVVFHSDDLLEIARWICHQQNEKGFIS